LERNKFKSHLIKTFFSPKVVGSGKIFGFAESNRESTGRFFGSKTDNCWEWGCWW